MAASCDETFSLLFVADRHMSRRSAPDCEEKRAGHSLAGSKIG
jgi:hypothetical protein